MKCIGPVLLGAILGTGCGRSDRIAPPVLRLGRDQCAECGMAIQEERFAAALLVERDGRREHLPFDDIGCMLAAERAGVGLMVVARFLHDHGSREWIAAENSVCLAADHDRLPTPMGSGIVAFADRASAEAARAEYGGGVTDYASLRAQQPSRLGAEGEEGRP